MNPPEEIVKIIADQFYKMIETKIFEIEFWESINQ